MEVFTSPPATPPFVTKPARCLDVDRDDGLIDLIGSDAEARSLHAQRRLARCDMKTKSRQELPPDGFCQLPSLSAARTLASPYPHRVSAGKKRHHGFSVVMPSPGCLTFRLQDAVRR
jgi:hypothetical protein